MGMPGMMQIPPRLVAAGVATLIGAGVAVAAVQERARVHPVSGRQIAPPMSVAGAPWLDRDEREAEETPSLALQIMAVQPGEIVADIGAGSGYFTERLARLVGNSGHVYASDIQPGMLELLARRMSRERLSNVTVIRGDIDNPRLPAAALDLALMVDVYHELGEPQTVLGHVRRALKPGGRLVLVEYKGEDPAIPILPLHRMTVAQARQEVQAEGFVLATVNSSLSRQHVLIFTTR